MPLSIDIDPNSVSKLVGGGYSVASKSHPGYFVIVWGNTCSCPATGPTCRHRKLVAAYCAAEDARTRPAPAKANVSAMVD